MPRDVGHQHGQPTGSEGNGTTETGTYTLTPTAIANNTVTRNANLPTGSWALASENEWYKAAYYDPNNATYSLRSSVLAYGDLVEFDSWQLASKMSRSLGTGGNWQGVDGNIGLMSTRGIERYNMPRMPITPHTVAQQLSSYLRQQWSLTQLVDWAEQQVMDGEFETTAVRDIVARLGVADVRAFGLTWEDCQSMLHELGFEAHVDIVAA